MSDTKRGHGIASAPLTAAAIRVLDLVLDHYSNREIAAELVCSPETVKTHVSHILAKLDVPNRRGAARVASENHPKRGMPVIGRWPESVEHPD